MNNNADLMQRCHWCTHDPDYIRYHDTEWGVPSRDPNHLFEMLVLEGFQAGLSWWTILQKRERFREVLFQFDPEKLASLNDDAIDGLMKEPGIVRNRLKLLAARNNAIVWLRQDNPVDLMWSFVDDVPIINHYTHHDLVPAVTPESERMSRHLKKLGFKFVGPTICQSYLQAIGAFMDHTTDCFRYHTLSSPESY